MRYMETTARAGSARRLIAACAPVVALFVTIQPVLAQDAQRRARAPSRADAARADELSAHLRLREGGDGSRRLRSRDRGARAPALLQSQSGACEVRARNAVLQAALLRHGEALLQGRAGDAGPRPGDAVAHRRLSARRRAADAAEPVRRLCADRRALSEQCELCAVERSGQRQRPGAWPADDEHQALRQQLVRPGRPEPRLRSQRYPGLELRDALHRLPDSSSLFWTTSMSGWSTAASAGASRSRRTGSRARASSPM